MGSDSKGSNNAPSDKQMTRIGGPWMPLQDPSKKVIEDAGELYENDNRTYGPRVVADFDPATSEGLAGLEGFARGSTGQLRNGFNYLSGVASGRGVGAGPAQGLLDDVTLNGVRNPVTGEYDAILDEAMGGSGGLDYLRGAAGGDYLENSPFLDQNIEAAKRGVTDTFTKSVIPGIEGRMSMSGRLGSPVEQDLQEGAFKQLSQQLGDIEAGMRGNAFESERGRQQQAALALPGAFNTEIGTKSGAAGQVADDEYKRLGIQLDAANSSAANRRADTEQALGAARSQGAVYAGATNPHNTMVSVGKERQGQQERVNAEDRAEHEFNQNEDYARLQRYLQTLQGVSGMTNAGAAAQYAMQQTGGPSGTEVAIGNTLGLLGAGAGIGSLFMDKPKR